MRKVPLQVCRHPLVFTLVGLLSPVFCIGVIALICREWYRFGKDWANKELDNRMDWWL